VLKERGAEGKVFRVLSSLLTPSESKAAHHAISTLFSEPIDPAGKPLVVQYEVKLQKGLDCGGAYIKLLTEGPDGEGLRAGDEYTDKVSCAGHFRNQVLS
jgi:hypothetical protein